MRGREEADASTIKHQAHKSNIMKIDLTLPEKALQYLASLDTDEVIETPDFHQKEPRTAAQEALLVAFECNCADLGSRFGYEIKAGVAVATLKADAREAEENRNC